jgi:uncharacterized damage-inducible protein DinB
VFRSIGDFESIWAYESEMTLKVLRTLTPVSLATRVSPEGRTLGFLAWHVVASVAEMGQHAQLRVPGPAPEAPEPPLAEIIRQYEVSAPLLVAAVKGTWTDAMLQERIPMYGEEWPRGQVLSSLVLHQAHHRGQMTVLMRQAGLPVPGVYGPAKEEWAAMGMPAQP